MDNPLPPTTTNYRVRTRSTNVNLAGLSLSRCQEVLIRNWSVHVRWNTDKKLRLLTVDQVAQVVVDRGIRDVPLQNPGLKMRLPL